MSLAVQATGLLSYTETDATDGKIVTVGTVTYTLKTGALSAAGHVKIVAANPDATARNLVYAINGTGGSPGIDYYATPANPAASALLDAVNNQIRLQARQAGAAGNAVAVTTNEPEFTAPGTLSGGIDGSALVPWSILTLAEAKLALRVRGDAADEEIVSLLAEVADIIEDELGFRPVADIEGTEPEADLDEYHDLANPQGFLYVRRRPVRSITTLYLDGTALGASDYVLDSKAGLITLVGATVTRMGGSLLGGGAHMPLAGPFVNFPEDVWRLGSRYFPAKQSAARVLYKGGWETTDTVPASLKSIAIDILARLYRTRERKSQGVMSEIAQGLATAQKYDPKAVSEDLRSRLRGFATLTTTARE